MENKTMSGKQEFIDCVRKANLEMTEKAKDYFNNVLCVEKEKPILKIAGRFFLPKIGDKINKPDILININKNDSNCAIEKPRLIIYLLLKKCVNV